MNVYMTSLYPDVDIDRKILPSEVRVDRKLLNMLNPCPNINIDRKILHLGSARRCRYRS